MKKALYSKRSILVKGIMLAAITAIIVIGGVVQAAPASAASEYIVSADKSNCYDVRFVDFGDQGFFVVISGNDLAKAKRSTSGAYEVSQRAAGLIMDRYFTGLNNLSTIEDVAGKMNVNVPAQGFGSAGTVKSAIKAAIANKIYGMVKQWAPYATNSLCVGARHTGSGFYRPLEWYYTIN